MIKPVLVNLILFIIMFSCPVQAQTNTAFTSDNKVLVTLDGVTQPYTFTSNQLLVRYNKTTQRLECILDLATLFPANASVPPTMAYDVFFGAKFPDLLIYIDAPVEKINASNLYSEVLEKRTSVSIQGVANQTIIPVAFTPDRRSMIFSTTFDIMLDNFEASVPIKYLPVLTGRIVITINNARWVNMDTR